MFSTLIFLGDSARSFIENESSLNWLPAIPHPMFSRLLLLAFYICAGDLNSVPHDAFPHPAISSSHFLRVYVPSMVLPCLQERSLVLSIVRAFVNKPCPAHSVLGAGEEGCTENRDSGIQPQWWANWKLVHEQLIWRQKMQIHDRCLDNPRIFKYISG